MPKRTLVIERSEVQGTFLFSDIEGSTKLVEEIGDNYPSVLSHYVEVMRSAVTAEKGVEVGFHADTYFGVFESPRSALVAAVAAQRVLHLERRNIGAPLKVRMGLHTGRAIATADPLIRYTGFDVHRAARICAAGHGGQILLSSATARHIGEPCPPDVALRNLGTYRLKDIRAPETIWQALIGGLPTNFPALRSLGGRPNNLPTPVTPFIGRARELARLRDLTIDDNVRLITLTGSGGTGKTRLALQNAALSLNDFPGGVFLVDLSPITNYHMVLPAIAEALNVHQFQLTSISEYISNAISDNRVLLLLDNFEQVIGASGQIVQLLERCKTLKVLVTSRESLNVNAEYLFPVQPLATSDVLMGDDLYYLDSVQLFIQAAKRVDPHLAITDKELKVIGDICFQLDGLPLALELAASRLRLLSPSSLLRRLNTSVGTLGTDSWGLGGRHKTISNSIQWSYDLLTETERRNFRTLCVFSGKFDLDTLQQILARDGDIDSVFEVADSLIRKSLVQRQPTEEMLDFRVIKVIRDFGLSKLQAHGELRAVRNQHAATMLHVVEKWSPDVVTSRRTEALPRLISYLDDIRSATEWALEQVNLEMVSKILSNQLWLWISLGQFVEGNTIIERAQLVAKNSDDLKSRVMINDTAAWFKVMCGDWHGAYYLFKGCVAELRHLEMSRELPLSMMMEGITCVFATGNWAGLEQVQSALETFRERGELYGEGLSLTALGEAARIRLDFTAALRYFEEALSCMRSVDNTFWIGALLENMAQILLKQREWSKAAAVLREVSKISAEYQNPLMEVNYFAAMGHVAVIMNKFQEAAKLLGATEKGLRSLGVQLAPADDMFYQENLKAVTASLGQKKFERYFRLGASWDRVQTLDACTALH
jgi:predicted ATPase/class 3 adenylate cyclase